MERARDSRRRYWIDSELQGRFVRAILSVVILTLLFGGVVPVVTIFALYKLGPAGPPNLPLLIFCFILLSFVLTGAVAYYGVRVTHRVSGPIYRLEQGIEAIRQGEKTEKIVLRKGDELQGLVDSFNELAAASGTMSAEAALDITTSLIDAVDDDSSKGEDGGPSEDTA